MAENWPADLPQCFLAGTVSWQLGDARLRTRMEAGPAKGRRRTSAVSDILTGTMKFTLAQWEAFKVFVNTTIQQTDPFNFPSPDTAASGSDILVMLGDGMPRADKVRGHYIASIQLEVLPQ